MYVHVCVYIYVHLVLDVCNCYVQLHAHVLAVLYYIAVCVSSLCINM